jgi:hypothetical protein
MKNVALEGTGNLFGFKMPDIIYSFFCTGLRGGRPRRRWEDNIKMDLQEVGGRCGDWMELAQDRDRWRAIVGTVRDFRVP